MLNHLPIGMFSQRRQRVMYRLLCARYGWLLLLFLTSCVTKHGTTIAFTSAAISAGSYRGGASAVASPTSCISKSTAFVRLHPTELSAATSEAPTSSTSKDSSSRGNKPVDDPSKVRGIVNEFFISSDMSHFLLYCRIKVH